MGKENAIIINGVRYDLVEDKNANCKDCALKDNCDYICGLFDKAVDDVVYMIFKERKNK